MIHTNSDFKCFLTILFIFGLTFEIKAQEKVVTGFVTTLESMPLIGATVTVKSSDVETTTDAKGVFSLTCNREDVLKVSANGFYSQRVKIKENTKYAAVNLKMKSGRRNNSYGYGYVSEEDKSNALVGLNDDDLDLRGYSSLIDVLEARFAGVRVSKNGTVVIRGQNSIYGSSGALIVVDGVIMDSSVLAQLPPSDVKRIDIIKDSDTALYGFKGGNGVLLIETRSGID